MDVVAEPLAQRRVQQMGGGVVAHRRVARLAVNHRFDRDARLDRGATGLNLDRLVVPDPVDVDDLRLLPAPAQDAGVGNLAAALGVEGALLELDQGATVLRRDRGEAGGGAQRLVADEPGRGGAGGEGDHLLVAVLGAVGGGGTGAGPLALLLHQLLEAGVVDRQALVSQQLLRQVVGEAIGVVQFEGVGGVDPGGLRFARLGDQPLQQLGAALQGAAEALLLVVDPAGDRLPPGDQLRVGLPHQLDRQLREAGQPRRLQAQRATLLDRPAHDPPQDVAAVLVGGDDAVGEQEGGPARVVGDDPHCPRHRVALLVAVAAELLGEADQRPHVVGLVDRGDVLKDRRHPVQPHAGVDVAGRQRGHRAVLGEVVAHEDVVPELEEAVAVAARPLIVAAELRAAIEIQLRARPARPGRAGLPEVVLAAEADDSLLRNADPAPDLDRLLVGAEPELLVAAEDGDPDQLGVHPEALGRELPAPGDRLRLEVVPEAPVAEHLEEGQVASGVANLLDVGRAEAFLHVGEARRRRLFAAEEVGLEGLHPGRGEQHRGVVDGGNQRRGGDDLVPPPLEEREVGVADLLGLHVREPKYSADGKSAGLRALGRNAQAGALIVPCPTIVSPSNRTAVWPGEAPTNSSPNSTSRALWRPTPAVPIEADRAGEW